MYKASMNRSHEKTTVLFNGFSFCIYMSSKLECIGKWNFIWVILFFFIDYVLLSDQELVMGSVVNYVPSIYYIVKSKFNNFSNREVTESLRMYIRYGGTRVFTTPSGKLGGPFIDTFFTLNSHFLGFGYFIGLWLCHSGPGAFLVLSHRSDIVMELSGMIIF